MADFLDAVWEFTRGDSATRRFTVKNAVTAAAVDITGWTAFRFTAKDRVGDADAAAVIAETLAGGGIVKTTPLSGILDVTIAPADTASLAYETYHLVADLQGVDASSNVWTVWKGRVIIHPDASRTSP
jgi:hypothetical protein